ncbi:MULTISPECIES: acyltransferase [Pseudomonas]|uniref:acyltransferase n=1 Tax=Pseudomonas guariconensis TaxID=1288410 RepID=UPI002097111E|nr:MULTISPECIES: acyltransferase [Pseudomonas]MCO7596018.1 acyltransferase [Pseudomonas guariconensis]MCU7222216.1 acyltransferase [Pseudomonas brassicacearum]
MPVTVNDKGVNNKIDVPDDAQGVITIQVEGNGNVVKIGNLQRVGKLNITISGDGGVFEADPRRLGDLRVLIKNGAKVVIGEDTSIEGAYILADNGREVRIGRDCMISFNVQLRTTDAHGIYSVETGERLNSPGDILIEDHVWVGQAALISKGTQIGRNSIVGASSFLQNKEYPASCIVAGTPGKLIRTGVVWDRRQAEKVTFEGESMDPNFQHWWHAAQEDYAAEAESSADKID